MTPEEKRSNRRAYNAGWHAAHREEQRAKMKAYYQATKEAQREKRLARLSEDKAVQRAWYQRNAKRLLEVQRQWRERNIEKVRSRQRARRRGDLAASRLRERDAQHRRRATLKTGGLSPTRVAELLRLQRRKCANCRGSIAQRFHIDHIVPLARGGEHCDSNVQLLCPTCNHRKHAKDPIQWAQEEGRLV